MDNISRSTIFGAYPKWQHMPIPAEQRNGTTWSHQISEAWKCTTKEFVVTCLVRNFSSPMFGNMRHLVTKFANRNLLHRNSFMALKFSDDPTYNEKVYILQAKGAWKKIAVEVFPTVANTVDAANLYHLWEFEDEQRLPFDISHIRNIPEHLKDLADSDMPVEGIEFALHSVCSEKLSPNSYFGYLYLRSKDGHELKWKEKQIIKNQLAGKNITAVEVISDDLRNLGYTCLVCLPLGFELDFGIHNLQ